MIDLQTEIYKPVLRLDFTANGIMKLSQNLDPDLATKPVSLNLPLILLPSCHGNR